MLATLLLAAAGGRAGVLGYIYMVDTELIRTLGGGGGAWISGWMDGWVDLGED